MLLTGRGIACAICVDEKPDRAWATRFSGKLRKGRKVSKFRLTVFAALVGASSCTHALAQGYRAQGDALLLCYTTAALGYALRTCEPTATLIDAVFGKCAAEERTLQQAVERSTSFNSEASANVIEQVRADARPKITSLIIDTRIKSGNSCR
jgi:hypothetical protein